MLVVDLSVQSGVAANWSRATTRVDQSPVGRERFEPSCCRLHACEVQRCNQNCTDRSRWEGGNIRRHEGEGVKAESKHKRMRDGTKVREEERERMVSREGRAGMTTLCVDSLGEKEEQVLINAGRR